MNTNNINNKGWEINLKFSKKKLSHFEFCGCLIKYDSFSVVIDEALDNKYKISEIYLKAFKLKSLYNINDVEFEIISYTILEINNLI